MLENIFNYLKFVKYNFKQYNKHKYNKIESDGNFSIDAKLFSDFNRNGYVVLENFLSKKECNNFINSINQFISKKPKYVWNDKLKSDTRIFGAENISLPFNKISKNQFIKNFGSRLFQQNLSLLMIMANKLIYKKNNLGSGSGWHRDAHSKQFKAIIYLTDVKNNNGPFQLIEKSNSFLFNLKLFIKFKLKFPNTRFLNEEIQSLVNKKNKITTIQGKPGTMILINTNLIHRGSPIKKGKRLAFTYYFYPVTKLNEYKGVYKPKIQKKMYN